MKKLLSLASTFSLIFVTQAQIVIDSDDLPQPGTTYTVQESTPDLMFDYSATGEDYTWDYSELVSNGEVEITIGDLSDAPAPAQLYVQHCIPIP